jgi:type VI secretion system protein ImpE
VLNGEPFDTLRDEDELFGTVLEVLALGKYYWLPLEQAEAIALNPPRAVRDLLWAPAYVQVRNGPEGDAYLPALYPNTHTHPDDAVRLGRLTEWTAAEGGPAVGVGLHSFLVSDEPIGLLEWRQLMIG